MEAPMIFLFWNIASQAVNGLLQCLTQHPVVGIGNRVERLNGFRLGHEIELRIAARAVTALGARDRRSGGGHCLCGCGQKVSIPVNPCSIRSACKPPRPGA